MALSIDATSTKIHVTSNITSTSWSHNNGGNVLYVLFAVSDSGTPGVTFNGDALTQIGSAVNGREVFAYRLVNPDIGNYTIEVSSFSSGWFIGYAISFNNCDTSNPEDDVTTATGTSTSPSINVPSKTGNIVIDIMGGSGDANPQVITIGANQTEILNQGAPASWIFAAGSYETGSATTTMSHSLSASKAWATIGLSVNDSGIGGNKTTWFFMRRTKTIWDNIGGIYIPRTDKDLVTI